MARLIGKIGRIRQTLPQLAGRMAFLVLLMLSTAALSAWGAKKAEELNPSEPAEAYLALVRGDTAREKGDFAAALKAYEDALARYQRIAEVHPDWESDIVQYRIVYCRQQIAEVQKQVPTVQEGGAGEVAEASDAVGESDLSDSSDLSDESDVSDVSDQPDLSDQPDAATEYLRNRIAELLQQVEELEAELEKRSEEGDAENLRAELEEAKKRAEEAEARAAELDKEVRRLSRALAERGEKTASAKTGEGDAQYAAMMQDALKRERAGDWRGALALYEQARKRKSADLQAVLGQARGLISLGQLDKALAVLEKQKEAENEPALAVLRATALGILGRYAEAASLLEPFLQQGATDPWIYNLLGAAWLAMGRYDEAREALEKAMELAPDFAEPHYNLAVWYVKAGNDLGRAREQYQQSVKLGGLTDPEMETLLSGKE